MPVFNGEKTVAGSINSIISQTFENWELIVVGDNSTDRTEEEVKKFKDKKIRYFRAKWHGQNIVKARNLANEKARAEICVIQDADDYSLPDRLEKTLKGIFLVDILIAGTYINTWDNQYNCIRRIYAPPKMPDEGLLRAQTINGWCAYRKSVWRKKPFREETRYQYDWMMHLDWWLSGFRYGTLNEGLYEYVRYADSASVRFEKSGERAKAREIIRRIVKEEYGKDLHDRAGVRF